jgi:flavin reductase (DIM6/NTAB) family NADH-FMN oxidoreductase RutF
MTAVRAHAHRRLRPTERPRVSPEVFRSAMAAHPAGVVVVTGRDEDGPVGLTATSFVSISLDPPLVGFAVDVGGSTWPRLRNADTLVVHLLAEGQHDVATLFATKNVDRFADPDSWVPMTTGEPLLTAVSTWLRCRTEEHIAIGDHVLVVARVLDACTAGPRAPLLYHDRGYRAVRDPGS